MAKLNAANAKKVDAASSSFDPIPDGVYHATLISVDSSKSGPAGAYWVWEYKVADGPYAGRRLWNNTTLAEGKQFGLKQTFEAFGVPTNTDTDDLCGRVVKLIVKTRVIQKGARAGEEANAIDRVSKADDGFKGTDVQPDGDPDSDDPENVFG